MRVWCFIDDMGEIVELRTMREKQEIEGCRGWIGGCEYAEKVDGWVCGFMSGELCLCHCSCSAASVAYLCCLFISAFHRTPKHFWYFPYFSIALVFYDL